MERLTEYQTTEGGIHFVVLKNTEGDPRQEAFKRLAAYEDTGLGPTNIRDLRNELCLRCGNYKRAHLGACDGCRWRQEKVEEDRRLVASPVLDQTSVPQCFYGNEDGLCPGMSFNDDDEPIEACKRCRWCSAGYFQLEASVES